MLGINDLISQYLLSFSQGKTNQNNDKLNDFIIGGKTK